jgi:uncharacterized protein (DUF1501 family)
LNADAESDGVSNRELLEVLGGGQDENSVFIDARAWGRDVATAVRLFGFGTAACVVTRNEFDLHSDEERRYPPLARDLVRQLAGLRYLLPKMPHALGGTYWDHTVIAVVSEFSRNNTFPETGFNSARGSDHVEERQEVHL